MTTACMVGSTIEKHHVALLIFRCFLMHSADRTEKIRGDDEKWCHTNAEIAGMSPKSM